MSIGPAPGGLWFVPALGGGLLIVIGIALFIWPELLAFVVASVFVMTGLGLLGSAWRSRGNVVYRRIDRVWHVDE